MREQIRTALAAAKSWLPDVLMMSGASGISYGAALVYEPLGYVVGGVFALIAGLMLAKVGK